MTFITQRQVCEPNGHGMTRWSGTVHLIATGLLCFTVVGALALAGAVRAHAGAVTAPVRAVKVSWGTIGYRSVGRGRPLVLLMGGAGPADSIDEWPPALIDALARTHRVLAMDYEGIGRTTLRPGTMTIPRLADDTATFIAALHLARPDVLGWSMGGFVAQALALRHTGRVRRLILCATAAGDGHALGAQVFTPAPYPGAYLFAPGPGNAARARAFERSVHRYPHFYQGPQSVANRQFTAFRAWLNGAVGIGHRLAGLRLPVLIGDGKHDQLLPVADSQMLAAQIPHAQLTVYSDAAHGFLFQHIKNWAARVARFLR